VKIDLQSPGETWNAFGKDCKGKAADCQDRAKLSVGVWNLHIIPCNNDETLFYAVDFEIAGVGMNVFLAFWGETY
jgi:hypothetical protein